ncbi:MAG: hypothetical protein H6Q59_2832 [Firmicutes bacterium]|nr:hypothetical protein [Bacillota bacterium]
MIREITFANVNDSFKAGDLILFHGDQETSSARLNKWG